MGPGFEPQEGGRPRPDQAGLPARRRAAPWLVLVFWAVVGALLVPLAGRLGEAQVDDPAEYLPAGADSTRVVRLQQALPGGETADLVLVVQREGGLTAADRAAARAQLTRIDERYRVTKPAGDALPQGIPAEDGDTVIYPFSIGGLPDEDARTDVVDGVRELAEAGREGQRTVAVAGPAALAADTEQVFESIDSTLTTATAGIVALLLILTYRSPVLWLLPLLSVGVAALCAMAVVYGLIRLFGLTVTTMSTSIMTVLVFGAGTDYALLLVARYREELRRHRRPWDAMLAGIRGAGPALLASSGTVAAGLLCLLAADLNSSRGLGPVGAVGVLCALAVMTTLLPALLVLAGRRVFWPLVPRYGSAVPEGRGLFARMGGSVSRRPVTVLIGGTALLGILALGILNLPGPLKQEDGFTDRPESVAAMELLAEAYPERSTRAVTVLARTDRATAAVRRARTTEGVAAVVRERSGNGWTELSVRTEDPPESKGEQETIRALRDRLHALPGAEAAVGGLSAQRLDLETTNVRDRGVVIPLVLAAVLLILMGLLRSVVAPVVLLGAVVASWGAALGLGGLVFGPLLGFQGFEPALPLLTFVFGVALGVDYGIFLMHRMREESRSGVPVRQAALSALRSTGGVIASAGIVLAATFSVLATMPLVMMVELGFVVAAGVLLDAFLVRTYLVTSASRLLGRWVWWPGALHRAPPPRADGG